MAENDAGTGMPGSDVDYNALPVGAGIGRFVVTSILGQGGFGITYRARDEQLGREVAIKEYLPVSLAIRQDGFTVLPRSTKAAEDFSWGRERFVAEGRTLASLHDAPAIVRVFDFLELNGTAYIVMELVRGETLEDRMKKKGKLTADEVQAILWPLLDGLEQVHKAGFLHRDIKPANILLREDGRPTLIDFGASRAAMAGRTTAMTAIFTPGYAAGEQMTAAKQGPWTDIYGLAATLYHAITGAAPPSAFDRMLDDEYVPLTRLAPAGFPPGLLVGLDAGLAVRSAERPQSIAGWRALLGQTGAGSSDATMALGRGEAPPAVAARPTSAPPPPAAPAKKSRTGLFAALGAAAVLALGGGGWLMMGGDRAAPKPVALQEAKVEDLEKALDARRKADAEAADKRRAEEEAQNRAAADAAAKSRADDELKQAADQRQKAEAELARLREELEAQKKAAAEQRELADAQAKRAAAEEARRKIEAEMAALKAAEEEARRKVAVETEAKRLADEALAKAQEESQKAAAAAQQKAEAEAKQKAEADAKTRAEAEARVNDRKTAEAAETGLRLSTVDRQRLQVALTALGFNTGGSDGAFGPRTRQMVAGWQKSRNEPDTGFLTAAQQQALLRDAAPAVARFDDEQKKQEEEARKKADEEAKAKAAAAAAPPPPAVTAPAPAPTPAPAPQAATAAPPAPKGGVNPYDGRWSGMATFGGTGRSEPLSVTLQNGQGSSSWRVGRCNGTSNYAVNITPDGKFAVHFEGYSQDCLRQTNTFKGALMGNSLQFRWAGGQNTFTLSK